MGYEIAVKRITLCDCKGVPSMMLWPCFCWHFHKRVSVAS